jgi:hypothetical protein
MPIGPPETAKPPGDKDFVRRKPENHDPMPSIRTRLHYREAYGRGE